MADHHSDNTAADLSPSARAAARQEAQIHHASVSMTMAFLVGAGLGVVSFVALVVTWAAHGGLHH